MMFHVFFRVVFSLLLLSSVHGTSQPLLRKALFLGNSYTYVNNLPLLTAALAHSAGDSLYHDSYAPGGYTLGWQPVAHSNDPLSLARISSQYWDFVILQEQSQTPAIDRLRDSCMLPASVILHDSIKSANPCSRVLFYLTWGRRFGGVQCFSPNYCSANFTGFDQMQDTLTVAYKTIADSLDGWIAPVGEAWRHVISTTGMVLHSGDDSHPNLNGSYLAACVFYSVVFGKSPVGLAFTAGLAPDTALILQRAADSIAIGYASLWNLSNDVPHPAFTFSVSGDTLFTHNLSTGAGNWRWSFGDGQTSALFEPFHVYSSPGTWMVTLAACNDCFCDSVSQSATITTTATAMVSAIDNTVKLIGPDGDGALKIQNFAADGSLTFYDVTGKITATLPVQKGVCPQKKLNPGIFFWVLTNSHLVVVEQGKIVVVP
jgi:hypothetical protein